MKDLKKKPKSPARDVQGFTIVELLIVIVIIAILATLSVTSLQGITKRANNSARATEVNYVVKILTLYKASKGEYPAMTAGKKLCVGNNYPNQRCRNFTNTTDPNQGVLESDTELSDKLREFGSLPTSHVPVAKLYVGPFIDVWSNGWGFSVVTFVQGEAVADCPPPMTNVVWNDSASDTLMCSKDYLYATLNGL